MTREERFARDDIVARLDEVCALFIDKKFKKAKVFEVAKLRYAKQHKIDPNSTQAIHFQWACAKFIGTILGTRTDEIPDWMCWTDPFEGEVWRFTDGMTLQEWEMSLNSRRKNARRVTKRLQWDEHLFAIFLSLVPREMRETMKFGDVRARVRDYLGDERLAA